MAIVHKADLRPSKLELLSAWLPSQDWYTGTDEVDRVATFRLDDPAGEVGVETFIVSSGDALFHVPMTYRAAPLAGGRLVGELEHSVLGHRWVYDGPSDPVYVEVTTTAITEAGHEVGMQFEDGTVLPPQEWSASVTGSGAESPAGSLLIARVVPTAAPAGAPTLTATWHGCEEPTALAWLTD